MPTRNVILRIMLWSLGLAARSDDFKEGLSAFLEKRNPEFRGQ